MPVTFDKARPETEKLVTEIADLYHADISDYQVSVGVVMAHPPLDSDGVRKGPALKEFRSETPFKVQLVNTADKLDCAHDVKLFLDFDIWETSTDARRRAIIDSALTRITLVRKDEEVVLDDLNRPKLKLRDYDYVHFGYSELYSRHTINSLEFAQYQKHGEMIND